MTLDDMAISFVLSYLAGSIPVWRDWLDQTPSLKKKIDECYRRALKEWSVNEDIRRRFTGVAGINQLRKYVVSKSESSDVSDVDELLSLWADELRNVDICYSFIIEHKVDWLNLKFEGVQKMIEGNTSNIVRLQQSLDTKFDLIIKMLDVIAQGIGRRDLSYLNQSYQSPDNSYEHSSNGERSLHTDQRKQVLYRTSFELQKYSGAG